MAFDPTLLEEDTLACPVSFNGKVRFTLTLSRNLSPAEVEKTVLQAPEAQKHLEGKTVKKVVVVPHKIVNIVLG